MGQIGIYFGRFIREFGTFFEYFIRESGGLLFVVILSGATLMIWFVWQKFKIKKSQADYFRSRDFED